MGIPFSKVVYFSSSQELTQPRRIHKIKGDGNCYFKAISFILTGVETNHQAVRDKVVRHMESAAIASKLQNYLNENVTNYLNSSRMDRNGIWATDAEIISTANLLGCDITVYCKVADNLDWQRFPAQFTLSQSTDACLYLDNSSGVHYNAILSVL
jgi:OTU-like cysteine protease